MGYDTNRFIGEIDEEFICAICTSVLEKPVQSQKCDHLFCEECIKDWLSRSQTCPVDRDLLQDEDLKPATRPLRNLLGKLEIKCNFEFAGCETIVKLEDLEDHVKNCKFNFGIDVPCTECGLAKPQNDSGAHNCIKELSRLVMTQQRENEKLNVKVKMLTSVLTDQIWPRHEGITITDDNIFLFTDERASYPKIAQSGRRLTSEHGYFEMTLLDGGVSNFTVLGLTCKGYSKNCQPGWKHGSIGYGSNGKLYYEDGEGIEFGRQWNTGDTIGCGIEFPPDFDRNHPKRVTVYFKHNSVLIGKETARMPHGGLFPTIGMKSIGAKVSVNLFPYHETSTNNYYSKNTV